MSEMLKKSYRKVEIPKFFLGYLSESLYTHFLALVCLCLYIYTYTHIFILFFLSAAEGLSSNTRRKIEFGTHLPNTGVLSGQNLNRSGCNVSATGKRGVKGVSEASRGAVTL